MLVIGRDAINRNNGLRQRILHCPADRLAASLAVLGKWRSNAGCGSALEV
jgi:hypothetical protein